MLKRIIVLSVMAIMAIASVNAIDKQVIEQALVAELKAMGYSSEQVQGIVGDPSVEKIILQMALAQDPKDATAYKNMLIVGTSVAAVCALLYWFDVPSRISDLWNGVSAEERVMRETILKYFNADNKKDRDFIDIDCQNISDAEKYKKKEEIREHLKKLNEEVDKAVEKYREYMKKYKEDKQSKK